jgi:hypothetical protein
LVHSLNGEGDRAVRSSISRIWRAFGLQPHRVETFKLSADPFLVEKVRDVVGLYLDPPKRALVLCVDEKVRHEAPHNRVGGKDPPSARRSRRSKLGAA